MGIQHIPFRNLARPNQPHHAGEALALVDGVGDEGLGPGAKLDSVDGSLVRDAVDAGVVVGVEDDIALRDVGLVQANPGGGQPRDADDLGKGLAGPARGVDADDAARARALLLGELEARNHAGERRARDGAHDHRVEEDAHLALLRLDLERPPREAEPAERVVRRAGRDGVRPAAPGLDVVREPGQRELVLDAKGRRVQVHVGAHEPRELDVAYLFVAGVVPVDPVLLDGGGLEAQPGCYR